MSPHKIAFFDLKPATHELESALSEAAMRVVKSGWYVGGPEVSQFESSFAKYVGAQHCVGLGNGLDALELGLRACGVKAGDEVIVPAHTYIASWLGISRLGAIPVPVRVHESTYVIDPTAIQPAITSRTKAILPVHLYGFPAPMEEICSIASQHGLKVVEDAAQAHGATLNGVRIGAHADVVCWSFYPTKNLGAFGDAGSITTNNAEIADTIRKLGNYGSAKRYVNILPQGMNSRLDPIQAAVLGVKLNYLDEWNLRRKELAKIYLEELAELPLVLPTITENAESAWHLFVVRTRRRDALKTWLEEQGISSDIHYPTAIHEQPAYSADFSADHDNMALVQAQRMALEVLSLPFSPHHTKEDILRCTAAIREFFKV